MNEDKTANGDKIDRFNSIAQKIVSATSKGEAGFEPGMATWHMMLDDLMNQLVFLYCDVKLSDLLKKYKQIRETYLFLLLEELELRNDK